MKDNLFHVIPLLTDFANFLLVLIILLVMSERYRLPRHYTLMLALVCSVPFFLNGVLFSPYYIPDQFNYYHAISDIRALDYPDFSGGNVNRASYFLALLPIPFFETVRSLGFANKLLYIFFVIFLFHKKVYTKETFLFLILYPSLVLYSGLSLRDFLILFFMAMSFYFMVKGNFLLALFFVIPLYYIKFQNFFIQIIFILVYQFLGVRRKGISIRNFAFVALSFLGVFFASAPIAMPLINKYRRAMWAEDGGDPAIIQPISGLTDFVLSGLQGGIYFLVKPLPWVAETVRQLIQSCENVVVFAFVFWVTKVCVKEDRARSLFWILFLLFSSMIYGLVVANFGTAARYRFGFFVCYVVFIVYDVFRSRYSVSSLDTNSKLVKLSDR